MAETQNAAPATEDAPAPNPEGIPTKEELQDKITTLDAWAVRALLRLYQEQTPAEQFAGDDIGVRNGRGFTPFDTVFLTEMAERLEDTGKLTRGQLDAVKNAMGKYAGQLVRIMAQEKAQALQLEINDLTATAATAPKAAARKAARKDLDERLERLDALTRLAHRRK